MRILVTGAGGYTGGKLACRLLTEGHAVRALVRTPEQATVLRAAGARVVIGDIGRRSTLAGIAANIDLVYHLVGTLGGGMRRTLVEGTAHLIDQCRAVSGTPPAIIFTSNAVVYGNGRGALLDEDSPCRPTFPLGQISLEAEEGLREAAGGARPIPVTILRCGAIYGPGRLSSSLIREGRFRVIGSGRNWSSRIYVDDLVSLLAALAGAPNRAALYCAVDREPSAVNDYYDYLAHHLAVVPPRHLPAWQARLRGQARAIPARLRGRAPFVDLNVVGLFTADLRLDGSRLWDELGLEPRYPSYRIGIPAALAEERCPAGQG